MKKLLSGLLCVLLLNIVPLPARAFNYTWLGVTNDWGNALNWLNDGGLGRLLTIPQAGDDVIIPQLLVIPIFYPVISSSENMVCRNITFYPATGMSLTVNGTLASTGTFLQIHNNLSGNTDVLLTGSGSVSCAAVTVGDNTVPIFSSVKNLTTFKCNVTQLTVSGLITANSSSGTSKTNNAFFNAVNDNTATCTITAGGVATTNNSPGSFVLSGSTVLSSSVINITNSGSNAIRLKLTNAAPVSIASATYGSIDFFTGAGTGSSTVEYAGATAQTVYTDNTSGLDISPSVYQHLSFSAAGVKNINSGNLTISGNWNSAGGNIDAITNNPLVVFQGTTQTLTDAGSNSGGGVIFKNVKFTNGGTKTISGSSTSAFSVSGIGVLTMASASTLTIGSLGKLTLISDLTGTATVAAIPSGCSITGNVNAQRYIKAGTIAANTRNYRLLSSPVNVNSIVSNTGASAYCTLTYLSSNPGVFTGGPGGTGSGFTVDNATPTVYLYKENLPASNTSFNSGNFKGIGNMAGDPLIVYNDAGTSASVLATLYAGNGYMLFYAGNNTTNISNKQFRVAGNYANPDASTATAVGTLNQGNIPVKIWWSGSTALSKVQTGYNLVGNPYASAIDWNGYGSTITATGVSKTIYVFNYTNKNYGTYQAGMTGGTGTNNASRYIASGQGFFVTDTLASGASLTFTEAAKTTVQPSVFGSGYLLMGIPAQAEPTAQALRIKLSKDSVNTDESIILFEPDAQNTYEVNNDALRLNGMANIATLATYAAQSTQMLSINHLHSIDSALRVKLYINVSGSAGKDTLIFTGAGSLDSRYNAFLIDHFKNDSLQIGVNTPYIFDLSPDSAASFGNSRFELAFHKKISDYHLLSFTGKPDDHTILINWKAEAELNTTGFTLEKGNGAGSFSPVYTVQSDGSGAYSWPDKSPVSGANLYRLKQSDAFDQISYSNTISVNFNPPGITTQILTAYPNPVSTQMNIRINTNDIPAQVLMKVISSSGQMMMTRVAEGTLIQQNVSSLYPGTYIVEISDNATKKVIGRVKISKP